MNTSKIRARLFTVLLPALLLAMAPLAHAHARPTHQTPAAGSTVTAPLQSVVIDFDDSLEPAFSSIAVTDAQGKPVTSAKAVVDATDRKRMSVTLKPLAPGKYSVAWVAVASDGHRTQGRYTFNAN